MAAKDTAVTGGIWYTMSVAATAIADLLLLTLLARILTPAQFGIFSMCMLVIGFSLSYLDMGLSAAVIQRQNVTREQFSSFYWLTVLSGISLCALISLLSPLFALFFKEPLLHTLLPVVSTALVIISIGVPFDWMLEKELQFQTLAKMDIFKAFAGVIVAVVASRFGLGIWSLVWGFLSRWVIATVWLLIVGLPKWKPMLVFNAKEMRQYLRFALYQIGERTLNNLFCRSDQLLIGSMLGAQALGYYCFAVNQLLQPICSLTPILMRIAFPLFAQMQDNIPALRQNYLKTMKVLNTLNAPLLSGLAAVSSLLVPVAFGAQWTPAIPLLQVLSLYMFLRNAGDTAGTVLLSLGRADLSFRWNLVTFATTVPSIMAGAKIGGTMGVATALALLMAARLLMNFIFFLKPLIDLPSDDYSAVIVKPALLASVMGGGIWFISQTLEASAMYLTGTIVTGLVLFCVLERLFDTGFFVEAVETLREKIRRPLWLMSK